MKALIILSLLLSVSCSRTVDGMSDSFKLETRDVKRSRIECYSGSKKFFEYETNGRIWLQDGGNYAFIESDRLVTTNGDCILFEYF